MLQFAGRAKRLSRCLAAAAFMLPWLALGAQDGTAGLDPKPIRALVQAFTTADRQKIAASLAYPLRRPYPLPPIRSKAECLRRFDELFDEGLISEIRASSVDGGDWTRMGTKGILFKTGALWLDEGYRILAVNHETAASRARMQALIDAQKAGLPARLRDFERPELEFGTAGGLIRVDRKGEDYRLLVFRGPGRTRVRLELHGGNLRWDGTLGSHHIDWQDQGKTHRVEASGLDGGMRTYYRYGSLIDIADWPDRPEVRWKRLASRSIQR